MARKVPLNVVADYAKGINLLSERMQQELAEQLAKVDFTDFDTGKAEVMRLMQTYCGLSASAAAQIGAEYYRIMRSYLSDVQDGFEPVADSGRVPAATDEATKAILQKQVDGQTEEFIRQLLSRLDFEARRAGLDNTAINAELDPQHPRLQRVAQGFETCDFCLMLCSREPSNYRVMHVHANCDCKLVPVYGTGWLYGYDYKAAYDRWQDALYSKAADRAERSGRTVEQEKQRIIGEYEASAARNKRNARIRIR